MNVRTSTGRSVRDVNLVFLSNGETISISDIATSAEGQAILDDLDGAILKIEDDLANSGDRDWRIRAEMALKKKRRQRPALQQRIGELRRAERQAAAHPPAGPGPDRRDARRKAFIDAAEEMLPPEVFTEVWARAQEQQPAALARADGGAA